MLQNRGINKALDNSHFMIMYQTFKWIQTLLILFGNSLVLLSGIKYKMLQTSSYYYLYSLSCADLILVVANITYFTLETVTINDKKWIILCHISINMSVVQSALNIFHFTLMGVERCIYVVFPLYARQYLNKTFALTAIIATWFITIISTVIVAKFGYSGDTYMLDMFYCEWPLYFNSWSYLVMTVVFVASTLLMMFLYGVILYKLIIKPR